MVKTMEPTPGKIIRLKNILSRHHAVKGWFYIIEAEDGAQYEVLDYTRSQFYEVGDVILASNYHYVKGVFQKANIVKVKDKEGGP